MALEAAGGRFTSHARAIVDEHWTRERFALVSIGLVGFYVTYVSYRNLKNYLPEIGGHLQDLALRPIDQSLMFGHEPAIVLHTCSVRTSRRTSWPRLPLLPADHADLADRLPGVAPQHQLRLLVRHLQLPVLGARHRAATTSCRPSGPPSGRSGCTPTSTPPASRRCRTPCGTAATLRLVDRCADSIQSVAGFASLHVGDHPDARHGHALHRAARAIRLVDVGLLRAHRLSTLYFGWHYIADDLAGAAIALFSVWLGGLATGQKFDQHGRCSHPTTSHGPW